MLDEEKAVAVKQHFEQMSDEKIGSSAMLNFGQISNEYLAACMKLGVERILVEETDSFWKEYPEAGSFWKEYPEADMKQFSYEEMAENFNLNFKKMPKEQIGKLLKDCIKHVSKENLAAFIKLQQEYAIEQKKH